MNRETQSSIDEMSDEQLNQRAMEILQRELGADGFARFLRVYRPGTGDFTRDRRTWQSGFTVRQIVEDIKKRREKSA